MVKCSFCGVEIVKGTGKMYVLKSGKILNFDNSKCEKSLLKLNRKAKNFKWTASYNREKTKEKS